MKKDTQNRILTLYELDLQEQLNNELCKLTAQDHQMLKEIAQSKKLKGLELIINEFLT